MPTQKEPDAVLSAAVGDGFSGVITVHRHGIRERTAAFGLADRTFGVPNAVDLRYGVASVTKAFTATAVLALVGDGLLSLDGSVRPVLGDDLPEIEDDVTVDHLLTHRSGIGDYFDEEAEGPPILRVPVQQLSDAEAYLAAIDGFPTKFPAGERFSYSNGGYVVLAIVAERVAGVPYAELVQRTVFDPAGMTATDFARGDRLHPGTATGYRLDGSTNSFHLPLVGVGDGGAHTTADDLDRFWRALMDGRLAGASTAAMLEVVTPADPASGSMGYGRGIWSDGGHRVLQGGDEGVSAWTEHDPVAGTTVTLLANEETEMYGRVSALRRIVS